jgi:putative protein-disulfide isomerase
MKTQLYYITDTYCCWCFGFSATMDRIAKEYSDELDINVVNGGMIPNNCSLYSFFSRFPDPVGLHQHISVTSGQQFGVAYLNLLRNLKESNRTLNSNLPAKAIIAFISLGVDALSAAKEIQNTHYIKGVDLQKISSYKPIAKRLNCSLDEFSNALAAPETNDRLKKDLELVRKLRVQGFPAIIIKNSDDSFNIVSNGFLPYEKLKTN